MSSQPNSEEESRITLRHTLLEGTKLCPRCLRTLKIASFLSGWLIPEEYLCDACGYRGPVAIEPSKESTD